MSLRDYVAMTRPANSLMIGFAVIVGAIVASGDPRVLVEKWQTLLLGYMTGVLLAAASMVLNDVIDVEVDRYNAPHRPLPSGRASVRGALTIFGVLTVLGLVASLLISPLAFALALAAHLVGIAYNVWGKRTGLPGNLMVSYTVMTPILYGSVIAGGITPKALVFSAIIFLANTGREVTKGIVDVYGDEIKGVRTVAVIMGRRAAAYVATAFYLTAVALSLVPFLAGMAGWLYLVLVSVVDVGLVYYSWKLVRQPEREVSLHVKNRVLALMLLGLIAFGASSVGL